LSQGDSDYRSRVESESHLRMTNPSHTLRVMHRQLAWFEAKQKLWRPSRLARALGL